MSPDLQTIRGTLDGPETPGLVWVDLLHQLPEPTSDRIEQRTWTDMPERGVVRLEPTPAIDRPRAFSTILPRRMGATGMVPGKGIYANGLWHPHPVMDGRSPIVTWDVEVKLPADCVGVLNGKVGKGTVRFQGPADRLSLAVVPHGRVQEIRVRPETTITMVDRGPPRNQRDERVLAIAMDGVDWGTASSFTVVETPTRRRLVRTGPHTLFLSDRATRLSGQGWRYHAPAIRRGLQTASLPIADPWIRGVAGGILGDLTLTVQSRYQVLKWRSFFPGVDAHLYNGNSPFMAAMFDETWPSDPLKDDPIEMIEGISPPHAVARKLIRLYGTETMRQWAMASLAGATPEAATGIAGLPLEALSSWRKQPPAQWLSVDVHKELDEWVIEIQRDADPNAPQEPIPIQIDNEERIWTTNTGPDTLQIKRDERPRRVELDPFREVLQDDRTNGVWPRPWSITAAAALSTFSVWDYRPTGSIYLVGRQRYDSRWIHGLFLSTNPMEFASTQYTLNYGFGPLVDRRNRTWRVWAGPAASLLDPIFAPDQPGNIAADMSAGIRWNTQDAWPIKRKGHKFSLTSSTGWIPGYSDDWTSLSSTGSVLTPLSGSTVLGYRYKIGFTTANVSHRQLPLGGSSAIPGLPVLTYLGQRRALSTVELRYTPIRHASIPLGMAWVTHMQLSGTIDAGWLDHQTATGWSAGLAFVADIFGNLPSMLGLWVADSLPYGSIEVSKELPPQLYLRATQNF